MALGMATPTVEELEAENELLRRLVMRAADMLGGAMSGYISGSGPDVRFDHDRDDLVKELYAASADQTREYDLTVDLRAMCERMRAALSDARDALIMSGYVGHGPNGDGDPEIKAIDAALGDQQTGSDSK